MAACHEVDKAKSGRVVLVCTRRTYNPKLHLTTLSGASPSCGACAHKITRRKPKPNVTVYSRYAVQVRRKSSTDEWVCRYVGCRNKAEHGYYTDDYDDAVSTARALAKTAACCEGLLELGAE